MKFEQRSDDKNPKSGLDFDQELIDEMELLSAAARTVAARTAKKFEEPLRREVLRTRALEKELLVERGRWQKALNHAHERVSMLETQIKAQQLKCEELLGQIRADQEIKHKLFRDREQAELTITREREAASAVSIKLESTETALQQERERTREATDEISRLRAHWTEVLQRDRKIRELVTELQRRNRIGQEGINHYKRISQRLQQERDRLGLELEKTQKKAVEQELGISRLEKLARDLRAVVAEKGELQRQADSLRLELERVRLEKAPPEPVKLDSRQVLPGATPTPMKLT